MDAEKFSWIKIKFEDLLLDNSLHETAFKHLEKYSSRDLKSATFNKIKKAYGRVIDLLLKRESPVEPKYDIRLTRVGKDDFNEEEYTDVALYCLTEKKTYAMDFCAWDSLVNMYVTLGEKTRLSKAEMLSSILWELTFWGFSPEAMAKEKKKLLDSIQDIERGDCISFASFEEFSDYLSNEV